MKHRLLRSIGPAISICLFVLAIVLIHHGLKSYRLQDIVHQLRQVGNEALLAAAGLIVAKYIVLTAGDALALQYVRHPVAYHKLAFASFVGSAFGNAATFVGGSAARYRIYSALGLSTREIAEMVLFCGYTFWLGFLLVIGVIFVAQPHWLAQMGPAGIAPAEGAVTWHVPASSVWIIGIGCLATVGGSMIAICLWRWPLTVRGWQLRVPSAAQVVGQIAITSIDWLLAAAVLYALLPSQMHVPFPRFVAIFMIAQGAGMISHVPGGLGVFETILLYSLPDGGAVAVGTGEISFAPTLVAALLLYRLVYYILPLLLGALLLAAHAVVPKGLLGETLIRPSLPLDAPE
jgi:uncharacterized membrane protein YbhN (UPF0104 family)